MSAMCNAGGGFSKGSIFSFTELLSFFDTGFFASVGQNLSCICSAS
jgi:hypothetical protein